jgi:phage shock protein A
MFQRTFRHFSSTAAEAAKRSESIVGHGVAFVKFALQKDNLVFTGALVGAGAFAARNLYSEGQVQNELKKLEARIERMEAKSDAKIKKLEAKMDSGFGELRSDLKALMMILSVGRVAEAISSGQLANRPSLTDILPSDKSDGGKQH